MGHPVWCGWNCVSPTDFFGREGWGVGGTLHKGGGAGLRGRSCHSRGRCNMMWGGRALSLGWFYSGWNMVPSKKVDRSPLQFLVTAEGHCKTKGLGSVPQHATLAGGAPWCGQAGIRVWAGSIGPSLWLPHWHPTHIGGGTIPPHPLFGLSCSRGVRPRTWGLAHVSHRV